MGHIEMLLLFFQITILLFIIIRSVRFVQNSKVVISILYYIFGMIGFLVSDLYWLAYSLIHPYTRMPFAVNEVGEWAFFLLMSASLTTLFGDRFHIAAKEILGVIIFMAANVILWIMWSGEWIEDVISGVVLAYYFSVIVLSMLAVDAMNKVLWIGLAILSVVLIASQYMTFIVSSETAYYVNIWCNSLCLTGGIGFYLLIIRSYRTGGQVVRRYALAFGGNAWCVTGMYMSSGIIYDVMLIMMIGMMVITSLCIDKVVKTDDIC